MRHASVVVDAHAFHPTAWRVLLEDVAAEAHPLERSNPASRPGTHRGGPIPFPGVGRRWFGRLDQPNVAVYLDEAQTRTRRSEPQFDFRADGDPANETAERIDKEFVLFVPTVVADLFAEQAGGNADADIVGNGGRAHGGGDRLGLMLVSHPPMARPKARIGGRP